MPSRLDRIEDKVDAVQSTADQTLATLRLALEHLKEHQERLSAAEAFISGVKGVGKGIAVLASIATLLTGMWKVWEMWQAPPPVADRRAQERG